MKFSVLMSVYHKEKGHFLDQALESILINQSTIPDEVILVKDGPLTSELEILIQKYCNLFPEILRIVPLEKNVGLGKALNIGLDKCENNIVARADSDDVNAYDRFEKQINVFRREPNIDVLGGNIAEFYSEINDIKFYKVMPGSRVQIIEMAKKRNPINHMTVMFKKSSVINAGGYKHLPYLEDYYLWVRMLSKGSIVQNINEILVYARTGENMLKRRSNPEYIKSWYLLQKEMMRFKLIKLDRLIINMINIITFIGIPLRLKEIIYGKYLRKTKSH
jgi:glycosyltransferase involved in cell wall biosynthesis